MGGAIDAVKSDISDGRLIICQRIVFWYKSGVRRVYNSSAAMVPRGADWAWPALRSRSAIKLGRIKPVRQRCRCSTIRALDMYLPRLSGLLAFATLVAGVLGAVTSRDFELEDRASGTKYVFAHFIVS